MTYLCPNTYRLNLILYFDAINGFPTLTDQEVYAHIFRRYDNKLMQVVFLPKMGEEDVPYYQEWCDNNEVETLRIIYGDTITLSDEEYDHPDGYYVAWENCCRNYQVTNVVVGDIFSGTADPSQPGDQSGQTYYLAFPPVVKDGQPFINSTPSDFPALSSYACPNRAYWADFSGIDPDGDSLIYSLVPPLDNRPDRQAGETLPAPYPDVVWQEGFGPSNIMNGDPDLSITRDGFLSVTPTMTGLFVFAVRIDEWRNGVNIGRIQREFQLYVDDLCDLQFAPVLAVEDNGEYQDVPGIEINYDLSVPLTDRCIALRITDQDTDKEDELITIRTVPLNFEGPVEGLIEEQTFTLKEGEDYFWDICFTECPLVDPFDQDIATFGIVVLDDACPLPLIDTLKVNVYIEPPANTPPMVTLDGQSGAYATSVTEAFDAKLQVPLAATDADGHNMALTVISSFNLDSAGISIQNIQSSPGSLSAGLVWDYGCNNDSLSFDAGVSIPSEHGTTRAFEFQIAVEDMDDCSFARGDTIDVALSIFFPDEYPPKVYLPAGNTQEDYYAMHYEIGETVDLVVAAEDGASDTDPIELIAVGSNYHLDSLGASFPVVSGPGSSPGIESTFRWSLNCALFETVEQDTFQTYFIVSDKDACHLTSADTLTIDFVLKTGLNESPSLAIHNLPGEVEVINNTLQTDFTKRVRFNLYGEDPDLDSLELRLLYVNGIKELADFNFETTVGKGVVSAPFELSLGCEKLDEGFEDATYTFAFLLEDKRCSNTGTDTLMFDLTVSDIEVDDNDFLPANIFTPNGDGINDFFAMAAYDELRDERHILPLDNCIGQFISVTIIDRNGKEVFFSLDREFKWTAKGLPAGVYFYVIRYTDKTYKGNVTVMF